MIRFGVSLSLSAVLVLAIAFQAAGPAAAKGTIRGSVHVTPSKIAIGKMATLIGKGLPGNRYYALLLSIPNDRQAKWRQYINVLAKADAHGNLKAKFRFPPVPACGKAEIDVYAARTPLLLRAPITVTGCAASKHPGSPPAPPPHKK